MTRRNKKNKQTLIKGKKSKCKQNNGFIETQTSLETQENILGQI